MGLVKPKFHRGHPLSTRYRRNTVIVEIINNFQSYFDSCLCSDDFFFLFYFPVIKNVPFFLFICTNPKSLWCVKKKTF